MPGEMINDVDHAEIGLIGLGVMGKSLALNMADHGFLKPQSALGCYPEAE